MYFVRTWVYVVIRCIKLFTYTSKNHIISAVNKQEEIKC